MPVSPPVSQSHQGSAWHLQSEGLVSGGSRCPRGDDKSVTTAAAYGETFLGEEKPR